MIEKPNFFVFTGGPGVGKTTLLRHLQGLGEHVVEESARTVIREQAESGGRGLPWIDPPLYARLTADRDIGLFDGLIHEGRRVFFDRGIMDSHGVQGAPPRPELLEAIRTRRYNRLVFVFPPWREIYQTDAERKQDWPEAERTFDRIIEALPALGYAPLVVPKADIAGRAAFVLEHALRAWPGPT